MSQTENQPQAPTPESVAGSFINEFGGSFVNFILGGLLLWIGQTTFEHNGELAGVNQQLDAMNKRHEALGERYDKVMDSINDRTRSRFTGEDGEKLSQRIKAVEVTEQLLNEKLHERLSEIRVQVSALEVQFRSLTSPIQHAYSPRKMSSLQAEMNGIYEEVKQLRSALRQADMSEGGSVDATSADRVSISRTLKSPM